MKKKTIEDIQSLNVGDEEGHQPTHPAKSSVAKSNKVRGASQTSSAVGMKQPSGWKRLMAGCWGLASGL